MIYSVLITTFITLSVAYHPRIGQQDQWVPAGSIHGEPLIQGQSFFEPTLPGDGQLPATSASEVGRFGTSQDRQDACSYFIRLHVWNACKSMPRSQRIAQGGCKCHGASNCVDADPNDAGQWEYSHWYCYTNTYTDGKLNKIPMTSVIQNFVASAKNDACPSQPQGSGLGDDCFGFVDQSLGGPKGGMLLTDGLQACGGGSADLDCAMQALGKKPRTGDRINIFWSCIDPLTETHPWGKAGYDSTEFPPRPVNYIPTVAFGLLAVVVIGGSGYLLVKRKREADYEELSITEV